MTRAELSQYIPIWGGSNKGRVTASPSHSEEMSIATNADVVFHQGDLRFSGMRRAEEFRFWMYGFHVSWRNCAIQDSQI
jgi:hypothetical protein